MFHPSQIIIKFQRGGSSGSILFPNSHIFVFGLSCMFPYYYLSISLALTCILNVMNKHKSKVTAQNFSYIVRRCFILV